MKEYEMLRQEIMENINAIDQYNILLYTVTVAVLAFVFEKSTPFMCLIPYIAIIPIDLLTEEKRRTNARISAYMIVFLEGKEHQWETRLYQKNIVAEQGDTKQQILNLYRGKYRNIPGRIPYLIISFVCSICAAYKVIVSNAANVEKLSSIIFIIFLTIFVVVMMIRNTGNYTQLKNSYLKDWQEIKAAEEAQKRKNDRNPQ